MSRCINRVQNLMLMASYVNEWLLIEQLGVTDKKMRGLRSKQVETRGAEGVYWPLEEALALAEGMGVELSLPEKSGAPEGTEELMVASIARGTDGRHYPNRNVIQARRANGELVMVRVKDSAKYRIRLRIGGGPMILRARPAESGNWWVLEGREPRWPGQW